MPTPHSRTSRATRCALAVLAVMATACFPDPGGGPSSGLVATWGYNGFGNLGDGTLTFRWTPVPFATPPGVQLRAVSAGGFHTLALATDGTIYAAGRDEFGQLGNDAAFTIFQASPVTVAAPAGVHFTAVSAGFAHSLAIGDDGVTYAWGEDANGQLGDSAALAKQPLPVPVVTPPGVHFTAVSAGYAHSLAIGSDGNLYSWGYNGFGELGNGIRGRDQALPAPIPLSTAAVVHPRAISAGGHHNLVIGDDGRTYSWGWDSYGQLGNDASFADQLRPVVVASPPGAPAAVRFTSVSAGAHHSLAIGDDGDTYSWGDDSVGALGDDAALANQALPVRVAPPLGVLFTQVAAGGRHSVAVARNGLAYTWGDDAEGELGDDAAVQAHPTPVTAATPSGRTVIAATAGYYFCAAITA